MTDHHAGYLVTLAEDIREDDAEGALVALRMIKGVLAVEPVLSNVETRIGYQRAHTEIARKLFEALSDSA